MPTFQDFITGPGLATAAAMITALVQIIKTVFPGVDAAISGALMAFYLSAVLYIITALALAWMGMIAGPNSILQIFACWITVSTAAIGIKGAFDHATTVAAKNEPVTDLTDIDDGGSDGA